MPQPDLVIFDCDGVLVDSEVIAARVDAELITAAGFPIEAEEVAERFAGLTFHDILLEVEKLSAVPLQASLIDEERKLLDARIAREIRAIDGAREAVARVEAPRCICSNSTLDRLDMMLTKTGLKPLFGDRIFSSRAIPEARPKPAPDVFLYAAKMLNADPENTFVLEDSVHGVHAARAAGMRVIGFTGASHSYPGHADRLTEAGAETVIRRLADFQTVLAALSEWAE
ncbi:HAD family phosphatase [Mesorhizobium sp. J428]|uniref:HAD family hydrolase n=1 Tax=Mesorhizobium sp. J428 TaxID=2898440 RepID=UPI00215149A7|nr:HAD family hydrolase [Mesorhizobium sp. J428]MCR5858751.1 HAD family hydrolase [Mesorhizobium sp. J428]